VSRQKHAKPDTYTERGDVDPTRISVKVGAQYPGRSDESAFVVGTAVMSCSEGLNLSGVESQT